MDLLGATNANEHATSSDDSKRVKSFEDEGGGGGGGECSRCATPLLRWMVPLHYTCQGLGTWHGQSCAVVSLRRWTACEETYLSLI